MTPRRSWIGSRDLCATGRQPAGGPRLGGGGRRDHAAGVGVGLGQGPVVRKMWLTLALVVATGGILAGALGPGLESGDRLWPVVWLPWAVVGFLILLRRPATASESPPSPSVHRRGSQLRRNDTERSLPGHRFGGMDRVDQCASRRGFLAGHRLAAARLPDWRPRRPIGADRRRCPGHDRFRDHVRVRRRSCSDGVHRCSQSSGHPCSGRPVGCPHQRQLVLGSDWPGLGDIGCTHAQMASKPGGGETPVQMAGDWDAGVPDLGDSRPVGR